MFGEYQTPFLALSIKMTNWRLTKKFFLFSKFDRRWRRRSKSKTIRDVTKRCCLLTLNCQRKRKKPFFAKKWKELYEYKYSVKRFHHRDLDEKQDCWFWLRHFKLNSIKFANMYCVFNLKQNKTKQNAKHWKLRCFFQQNI